jgi:hypothetical protein
MRLVSPWFYGLGLEGPGLDLEGRGLGLEGPGLGLGLGDFCHDYITAYCWGATVHVTKTKHGMSTVFGDIVTLCQVFLHQFVGVGSDAGQSYAHPVARRTCPKSNALYR